MGYEIDFMPVGNGEKSGDAIALRFGNLHGPRNEQTVIVVDGGTKESGEALVGHIQGFYKTSEVDVVICTHPDADHASGLSVVLENLKVNQLAMHLPWEHAEDIRGCFSDGRITVSGLERRLQDALQAAKDLESLARKKKPTPIPICQPFQGAKLIRPSGTLHILGPDENYYKSLLPLYRCTPEPSPAGLTSFGAFMRKAEEAISWVREAMHIETLVEPAEDATSAENNSSVVFLLSVEGNHLLFTGDVGVPALTRALDYAQLQGIDPRALTFLHVPHHGSKHNVGPTVLNRLRASTAFISASKDAPKHPAKKVTNALKRRGIKVFATRGSKLCYPFNAPDRGWGAAAEIPFFEQVEA